MTTDLYQLVGNSQGDAIAAIDALLRGIADMDETTDSVQAIVKSCRVLLARIEQERKKSACERR